jgi:hypothetical protein
MGNDRFEVLNTDDDMELLFDCKLTEFQGINGNCSMQGLFENLLVMLENSNLGQDLGVVPFPATIFSV